MQFFIDFWPLFIGKIVYGAASAIMLTACALYLSETLPQDKLNSYGFAVNLGVTTGISIILLFGAFVSKDDKDSDSWLMVQFIPIVDAIMNLLLWLFIFRTEPLGFCVDKAKANQLEYKEVAY